MLPGVINAKMIKLIFLFTATDFRQKHPFVYRKFVHNQTASKVIEQIHTEKLNLVQ